MENYLGIVDITIKLKIWSGYGSENSRHSKYIAYEYVLWLIIEDMVMESIILLTTFFGDELSGIRVVMSCPDMSCPSTSSPFA